LNIVPKPLSLINSYIIIGKKAGMIWINNRQILTAFFFNKGRNKKCYLWTYGRGSQINETKWKDGHRNGNSLRE